MEKILHHLGWLNQENKINHLSTGAEFIAFTVSHYTYMSLCHSLNAAEPSFTCKGTSRFIRLSVFAMPLKRPKEVQFLGD